MNKKQKNELIRILSSLVFVIFGAFLPLVGLARFVFCLIPYIIIGYDILLKAWKGICNRQPFDENFLMAVATVGAMILGEYTEGVAVMIFYRIGELFQSYAVGKSRRNIAELMDIRPDYANVELNGEIIRKTPDEVEVGTVIVIRPGEKIPIDGKIIDGATSLDMSALTGESIPRDAEQGDEVAGGCINLSGVIRVRTTKNFEESTVAKILDLVENASSRKSKSERFISRFAKYYTPVVCISALALAVLPPLFLMAFTDLPANFAQWIYRALTFLVISCPCALVISIPLGFFAGIGGASRVGVLVKGSNYLEILADVKCIAFDKTGTLTKGSFEVVGVYPEGIEEEKLIEYAAFAESSSTHPIAKSIVNAFRGRIDSGRISDTTEIAGEGVSAVIDGVDVAFGNSKLLARFNIQPPEEENLHGSIVYAVIDGAFCGKIVVSDVLKPQAQDAIRGLQRMGIRRAVMLTGDSERSARKVAEKLGIYEYYATLLPDDKVKITESLISEMRGKEKLAFAGDGINDAPVLSRADIGIAMGALGSDAAIEAADVVIMDDNPMKIVKAVRIAKKCMRIVYQNIYFAIGIKVLCLMLGAFGFANMWFAIFADVGVMVIAVLNAMRTLYVKKL